MAIESVKFQFLLSSRPCSYSSMIFSSLSIMIEPPIIGSTSTFHSNVKPWFTKLSVIFLFVVKSDFTVISLLALNCGNTLANGKQLVVKEKL